MKARAHIVPFNWESRLAHIRMLTGNNWANPSNVTILPFEGVARDLFTLAFGHAPRAASREQVKRALDAAAKEIGIAEFTSRFLVSEWTNVVDAWQIDSLDAYAQVPRLGTQEPYGLETEGARMAHLCTCARTCWNLRV